MEIEGYFRETIYYKKDHNGNMRGWTIGARDFEITMSHGVLDGEIQFEYEIIEEGKGGRTKHEQMLSRINSRIEKKLDKGYHHTLEEAQNSDGKNRLGLLKPMLAKKFYDVEVDVSKCIIQYKYDGFRCLITKLDGQYIAYSRNGKQFDSIGHIFECLNLNEGETLDGELYCHGEPLQKIASWAKKKQADSLKLKYHVYDFIDDVNYQNYLTRISIASTTTKAINDHVYIVPMFSTQDKDSLMQMLKQAVVDGYEGLMVRQPHFVYEDGVRSKGLLKLKSLHTDMPYMDDGEFLVTGMNQSSDGWAVCICTTKDGKQFKCSAPGTFEQKINVYMNQELYIGRYLHIGFAKYTDDGKPFQPVALAWRNKYDE